VVPISNVCFINTSIYTRLGWCTSSSEGLGR